MQKDISDKYEPKKDVSVTILNTNKRPIDMNGWTKNSLSTQCSLGNTIFVKLKFVWIKNQGKNSWFSVCLSNDLGTNSFILQTLFSPLPQCRFGDFHISLSTY